MYSCNDEYMNTFMCSAQLHTRCRVTNNIL